MNHQIKHFTIKNVILLSPTYAQIPCNKNEDYKLYKIKVAVKKDVLREVLDDAFRPDEIENEDVFEFCEVIPASGKIRRVLRLCEYENPEDYVVIEITSWNRPFETDKVSNFSDLLMKEFTVTCDIGFKQVTIKDDDGNYKFDDKGNYMKKDGGSFNATCYFEISDIAIDE